MGALALTGCSAFIITESTSCLHIVLRVGTVKFTFII